MNTHTRGRATAGSPSSGGGTASPTMHTTPSAGLTTSPSPAGIALSGSRKNHTHHKQITAATAPIPHAHGPSSHTAAAETPAPTTQKPATIGHPSRAIGGAGSSGSVAAPAPRVAVLSTARVTPDRTPRPENSPRRPPPENALAL